MFAEVREPIAAFPRRQFLHGLLGGAVASVLGCARAAHAQAVDVSVIDHGAIGDGVADDSRAIALAIRRAARHPGGRVRFPRGTYRLGHVPGGELLSLRGATDLTLAGDGAVLLCDTPAGTTSMVKLTDCVNVAIEGLTFRDDGGDRDLEWKGAIALYLTGFGSRGNQNLRVANCQFENVVAALMVSDGGGMRATNLRLQDLHIRDSYYGLNFQNNGDDVVATNIHCDNVKRAYFPYGVYDHRVELTAENNHTGFTDVLIKCYGRETANLDIKLRCRGKRGGDAIVAFDQQHPEDRGVIRDVRIKLDVAGADCRLNNIVLMRAFAADGRVLGASRSEWRDIALSGTVEYCDADTHLMTVGSDAQLPVTITMSPNIAQRVDRSRLRGVRIVEAGT